MTENTQDPKDIELENSAKANTEEGKSLKNDKINSQEESQEPIESKTESEKLAEAESQIAALKDQLLRQMAEFDNYRKRTMKEKSELILNGGQKVLESLLPVLDDLERAQDNINKTTEIKTLKEGLDLILSKLIKTLSSQGLAKIDTKDATFDTDFHEAIALVPVTDEKQKNRIIDCVQSGYTLNGKVIRHAKVAVGQ